MPAAAVFLRLFWEVGAAVGVMGAAERTPWCPELDFENFEMVAEPYFESLFYILEQYLRLLFCVYFQVLVKRFSRVPCSCTGFVVCFSAGEIPRTSS